ncbi:MAG: ribbon-helix-helix protein, CopG family [Dehalococcoidia bacterium]|nr:ribbon-helix-helix protein, CopG family [Dehalococcoidia bacterium]
MTRRGRPAKPNTSVEPVGVSLHPRTLAALDRHARAMKVSRSELVRWGVEVILERIRCHGRLWAIEQTRERRVATREREQGTEQLNNGKVDKSVEEVSQAKDNRIAELQK